MIICVESSKTRSDNIENSISPKYNLAAVISQCKKFQDRASIQLIVSGVAVNHQI